MKWRLAATRPELSTREMLDRLKSPGADAGEREMLTRMLATRQRQAEGTVAHSDHARDAATGRARSVGARVCAAIAVLLVIAAIAWLVVQR